RTIEDLTTFPGGASAERQIKTLVYVATDGATQEQYAVLALLRGDHQLHEIKLADSLRATAVRPAHPEEIRELLGASAGSLGGVGAKQNARAAGIDLRIVADSALRGRRNMTTGANKDDHHLRGVNIERDIPVDEWLELRSVVAGEGCPRGESGVLEDIKGRAIGHVLNRGSKY